MSDAAGGPSANAKERLVELGDELGTVAAAERLDEHAPHEIGCRVVGNAVGQAAVTPRTLQVRSPTR